MSDCDQDDYDDSDGFESDDDEYVFDPNREYPREVDTNFVCVDASSLVPEKLLKRGHNNEGVVCFLVRYKGFDEDLDDWVPISDLPIRLVDEFYCSPLNMETPHFDLDVDEYDGTNERDCDSDFEDDGDYTPFIPLSQKNNQSSTQSPRMISSTTKVGLPNSTSSYFSYSTLKIE